MKLSNLDIVGIKVTTYNTLTTIEYMITKKEMQEKRENREAFMEERAKLKFRLEQFRRNLKFGYSDANFATMAFDYNKISNFLSLYDIKRLGDLWSKSYVCPPPQEVVDKIINSILENIF